MDNQSKTYFLGKQVPDHELDKYAIGIEQSDFCMNAEAGIYSQSNPNVCTYHLQRDTCANCLFDQRNNEDFKIWIINQRLLS